MILLLLLHVGATLALFGVSLVMQVVHPLFSLVRASRFVAYQDAHMQRLPYVVVPLMLIELGTALALAFIQPLGLAAWQVWTGVALLGVIWLSTALLQAPQHIALRRSFDGARHQVLVITNWVRTVAWGLRAVLVLMMLGSLLAG